MNRQLEDFVPVVYRFAVRLAGNREAAEDLTQETMLRACRGFARLREVQAAKVWVLRICLNLWRDEQRRRARRSESALENDPPGNTPPPTRLAEVREDAQRAWEVMGQLPERQREVMYLQVCEELTVSEVSEILKISPGAVKASLSLARKQMRTKLRDLVQRPADCHRDSAP